MPSRLLHILVRSLGHVQSRVTRRSVALASYLAKHPNAFIATAKRLCPNPTTATNNHPSSSSSMVPSASSSSSSAPTSNIRLTEAHYTFAEALLEQCEDFAALRYYCCPRILDDGQFWGCYFYLLAVERSVRHEVFLRNVEAIATADAVAAAKLAKAKQATEKECRERSAVEGSFSAVTPQRGVGGGVCHYDDDGPSPVAAPSMDEAFSPEAMAMRTPKPLCRHPNAHYADDEDVSAKLNQDNGEAHMVVSPSPAVHQGTAVDDDDGKKEDYSVTPSRAVFANDAQCVADLDSPPPQQQSQQQQPSSSDASSALDKHGGDDSDAADAMGAPIAMLGSVVGGWFSSAALTTLYKNAEIKMSEMANYLDDILLDDTANKNNADNGGAAAVVDGSDTIRAQVLTTSGEEKTAGNTTIKSPSPAQPRANSFAGGKDPFGIPTTSSSSSSSSDLDDDEDQAGGGDDDGGNGSEAAKKQMMTAKRLAREAKRAARYSTFIGFVLEAKGSAKAVMLKEGASHAPQAKATTTADAPIPSSSPSSSPAAETSPAAATDETASSPAGAAASPSSSSPTAPASASSPFFAPSPASESPPKPLRTFLDSNVADDASLIFNNSLLFDELMRHSVSWSGGANTHNGHDGSIGAHRHNDDGAAQKKTTNTNQFVAPKLTAATIVGAGIPLVTTMRTEAEINEAFESYF